MKTEVTHMIICRSRTDNDLIRQIISSPHLFDPERIFTITAGLEPTSTCRVQIWPLKNRLFMQISTVSGDDPFHFNEVAMENLNFFLAELKEKGFIDEIPEIEETHPDLYDLLSDSSDKDPEIPGSENPG